MEQLRTFLSKNHILIPVINNKNEVIDYLNWEKVFEKKNRKKFI